MGSAGYQNERHGILRKLGSSYRARLILHILLDVGMDHAMKDADRAFFLRKYSRLSWKVIAAKTEYKSREGANMAAANYARKHNFLWPLPPAFSRGEIGYIELRDGSSWLQVQTMLGFDTRKKVMDAVRYYAKKHQLPWPPRWEDDDV